MLHQALLGKALVLRNEGHFEDALDLLNQLTVGWAWYTPCLVEKISLLTAMGDWEQAYDIAQSLVR